MALRLLLGLAAVATGLVILNQVTDMEISKRCTEQANWIPDDGETILMRGITQLCKHASREISQ